MTAAADLKRVNVVGSPCSGKTTASEAICKRLGLPHVELDVLYRGPHVEPVADHVFLRRVRSAVGSDAWLLDGDRASVRPLILDQAQAVVWLDYPIAVVLVRYFRRTLSRRTRRQTIWPETGTNEGLRRMLRRGSLFRLILARHGRRRIELLREIAKRNHLTVFRIRSPRQLRRWLATL